MAFNFDRVPIPRNPVVLNNWTGFPKAVPSLWLADMAHLQLHVASLGLHAEHVAFSGRCDGWLKELRRYLRHNRDFLVDYVTKMMPGMRITIPDATYMAWLDFTQLDLKKSPYDFFLKRAKVALSDGAIFGEAGKGHVRLNFGTSRRVLTQGLERIRKALRSL
jgi:cystathionine beta-lyase